jgi:hypothetical protein
MERNWLLAWLSIGFFCIGVYDLWKGKIYFIDGFIAAGICLIIFALSSRYFVSNTFALLAAAVLLPNELGQHGLYGWPALNYQYDWIVHVVVAFSATLAFTVFILDNRLLRDIRKAVLLSLLLTLTLGTVVEIQEYWGFRLFGFGDGYMGFESGDNSMNFGPWENSSLDLTNNLIGAFAAVGFTLAFRKSITGQRNKATSRQFKGTE